ncbi:hypothetical protein N7474_002306 [Penicillium riverlandense]|uniref:uncharacterized protein n=1 Tax=Penicillium riverlandense TaxID=1903569 RepID=UPI002547A48E|nr:uncharacterized protein N7474_002306 [Penicillium riverlandense]KAJ5825168.1 hypothetical protein N7474_002306 [Penicillium riverlandense]
METSTPRPNSPMNSKSLIEAQLEVESASNRGPDIYVNVQSLWRPKGARGIFGGITIGQSLNAAYETVMEEFHVHSMHCTFDFPGTSSDAMYYHVDRVRDGRTFITRGVKAMQNDHTIFLATIGFARETSKSKTGVDHATPIPSDIPTPNDLASDRHGTGKDHIQSPYTNQSVGISNTQSQNPYEKRIYQWSKARGNVSCRGGSRADLAALAFMSDSYFLAELPHAHSIWQFINPPITEFYNTKDRLWAGIPAYNEIPRPHLRDSISSPGPSHDVGMMVSLDHAIFFHNTQKVKSDEWLLSEIQTHWAGEGRGLMYQKIWTKEGTLVASCTQEGILRLEQNPRVSPERSVIKL